MNTGHICIRELRPDDSVAAITELLHAAYAPLAAMGFKYLATHQDEATTRQRLQSGISIVAELDGVIVGTVTLRAPKAESRCAWYLQPGVWSFGQFAVRPDLQRNGLGKKLMHTIEQRAIQHGATELALDTAEGATHLVRWYERLGFRFIQHVSWEETNYRSVVMSKRLSPAFEVNDVPNTRIATERDAGAISALIRRNADAVLAREYSSAQLTAWKRYNTPARIRERMKSRTTFCAFRSIRLCGTIALEGTELVGFYVSPSRRGQGIGKLLLALLEAFAISKGIQSLSLTSSPSATTFYSQHGWKTRRSVVLSILGVDFEETLMTKQLARP